jgi:predicted GNAT family acetyltransferase
VGLGAKRTIGADIAGLVVAPEWRVKRGYASLGTSTVEVRVSKAATRVLAFVAFVKRSNRQKQPT